MDRNKIARPRNRKRPQPKIVQRKDREFLEIQYYTDKGSRTWISTGTADEKDALTVLADFIKRTNAARLEIVPPIIDCIDFYSQHHDQAKYPITQRIKLIEYFGPMPATSVTRTICREYIKWRVKTGFVQHGSQKAKPIKKETAAADLRMLRACLNFCENERFCPKGSEFYVPAIPQGTRGADRYITKVQAREILNACPTFYVRLYILIALQSGHRQGAILSLPWSRIINNKMHFRDPNLKQNNKRRGEVPVDERSELFAMLSEARVVAQSETVVEVNGKPIDSIYNGVVNAGKRVGIDWLTPHLLKHSSCVWMAEGGVPLADIAALTCTSYSTIEKHYLSFTPDRGKRAVAALQLDDIA